MVGTRLSMIAIDGTQKIPKINTIEHENTCEIAILHLFI